MSSTEGNGNGKPPDALGDARPYLEAAIALGTPAGAAGDQRGCFELYSCAARLVIASGKGSDAVHQPLREALHQVSKAGEPGCKARILREAFDGLLAAAEEEIGDEPAPQGDPLQVIRSYLALAISLGAPAYNLGDQRGCYEIYSCTARMIVQTVEGAPEARDRLRQALEVCEGSSDPDEQAWTMRRAFDEIGQMAPRASTPATELRLYLALAIRLGAPAYNAGDHRGCYETYACTARLLVHTVEGEEEARARLRRALERCSLTVDVNAQAWIMRRAFDAILGEASREKDEV
jgi:hypothetical protein